MAIDRRGRPIVVWHDEITVSTRRIVVKRFDGSRWRALEAPGRVGGAHQAAPAADRPVKRIDRPQAGARVPSEHTQVLPPELLEDAPTTLAIKHP